MSHLWGPFRLAVALALVLSGQAFAQLVEPLQPMAPIEPPAPEAPEAPEGSVLVEDLASPTPVPDQSAADATPRPERVYPVSALTVDYLTPHPGVPSIEDLLNLRADLVAREGAWAAPVAGEPAVQVRIGDLGSIEPRALTESGLRAVQDRIVRLLSEERGILGVLVAPNIDQIEITSGEDLRPRDDPALALVVYVGVVTQVRSIASGERIPPDLRLNHPKHERIVRLSPIQPDTGAEGDLRRDLILRGPLDEYVLRLNRHPGRRVDVALAPGEGLNEATLDYLIAENKPWLFYAQLSNTGTESTDEWRERFGVQNTQLFNRDDEFLLEYITAGFSESHAVIGSYEFPVGDLERLRARLFGNYSNYTASDVGLANELFTGESYALGGELIWNFFQHRGLFLDLHAGARWEDLHVHNEAVDVEGDEQIFVPRVGLSAERRTEKWTLDAGLFVDFSWNDLTGASEEGLERLGRLDPDQDWITLQGSIGGSFFLEPILFGDDWADPTTWRSSTLAHEVAWSVRGQWALDHRLIPNEQQVLGGLYSVRGYPESVVAGDSTIAATLEYRWHIPRSFEPESFRTDTRQNTLFGKPFRARPAAVYAQPDWDLVLKAFTDVGRVQNSDRASFERDEDLWSAGVGLDFLLFRNLSVRVDWAVVLEDVESDNAQTGDNRWHFVFTLLF